MTTRGTCSACGRTFHVKWDGTLRNHRLGDRGDWLGCPGSSQPPAPQQEETPVSEHYPVWRCISLDDEDETQEIEVCATCVPKHSAFRNRASVPGWPCNAARGEAPR
jgi:hypothetical protein